MPENKSDKPADKPAPKPADKPAPQPQPETDEAGDDAVQVEGGTQARGAQVILTGEAQDAARGGLAGDLTENTLAKRALEADGTVADGTTPDGSTRTGKPAADVVVTEQAQAGGEQPAEPGSTRVESSNPETKK